MLIYPLETSGRFFTTIKLKTGGIFGRFYCYNAQSFPLGRQTSSPLNFFFNRREQVELFAFFKSPRRAGDYQDVWYEKKDQNKNNILTKDYFDKKLKDFVTKDYLDKKLSNYATKGDLQASINRLMKYIDFKLEPIEELRKKFDASQDHINRTLDWIVKKLEKYDQEYTIISARYPEITDQLESHETRITALEKKAYKTS